MPAAAPAAPVPTRWRELATTLAELGRVDAALRRDVGVPLRDALVLAALGPGGATRVGAVAAAVAVPVSTASRVLDRLEADGLVVRRGVDGDRRGVEVALTAIGRARRARVVQLLGRCRSSAATEPCQRAPG